MDLTVQQLAGLTGIPPETIRYHCRRGLLVGKAYQPNPRMWMIPEEAAAEFIAAYEPYVTLRVENDQA